MDSFLFVSEQYVAADSLLYRFLDGLDSLDRRERTGERLFEGIARLLVKHEAPCTINHIGSIGSVFFSQTFTKASFNDYLDDDYRATGILEGLVFDRVDGHQLIFAGSVSHPQTDEYIPLVVTLSNFGDVTISLDTQRDTSGSGEEQNNL